MSTTSDTAVAVPEMERLSEALAGLTARAAPGVVRVEGGRRQPASGAVWSEEVVVTASHALERDEELELGLEGGEAVPATLVGRDLGTDLAVLRAARGGLRPVAWSEEPPRPGQLALSLSRPGRGIRAGLALVARTGGEWRTPAGGRVDRWLELDRASRPGFSGGLLLDVRGRGLGLAAGGLLRGHALALPPETVRRVVEALLAHGSVRRGFLGVATLPVRLPPGVEREAGQATALLLTAVEPGSPAEQAGLLLGDALLTVEDRAVAHAGELLPFLEPERVGQALRTRLWRAGAAREVRVVVGVRPAPGKRP